MKVKIFDYGMNGEGVAKLDGKIVLVPETLIDEEVEISLVEEHDNYAIAKANKLLTVSKQRTKISCPALGCGGCQLNHMCYAEQLKFKQQLVQKTIKKIAKIDVEVSPCVASLKQHNYRNKACFVVGSSVGFYKTNSHQIVSTECCNLMHEDINSVLKIFKNCKNLSKNHIKNLVVRAINNQILVGVVASKQVDLTNFYNDLSCLNKPFGLFLIVNTRKDSVVLSGKVEYVGGIKTIPLTNFGINYNIDIMSFHQTNEDIQNKIYSYVLSLIEKDGVVVNAYSGTGLLSAIIATKAKRVVGVELNPAAHKLAEKLKQLNNISNLTNFKLDFEKFLTNQTKADTLLLNPPKKGCGKILEKIDTKNIIYISCNPITLAKDLQTLTKKYIIETATPYDMFPNTTNVETVVKLRRK